MKKTSLAFLFLFVVLTGFSQQNTCSFDRKNAVYLELGGSAIWYSLNYEHRIPVNTNHRIAFGGGVSMIPSEDDTIFSGTASANYLIGRKNIFEFGISPTYIFQDSEFLFAARVG